MATDELDHWLDGLAGRPGTGPAADRGGAEGRALRAQIHAGPEEAFDPVAEIDELREAQLIARARGAGLLPKVTADSVGGAMASRRRWQLPHLALLAASLAVAGVGIVLLRHQLIPEETLRGSANGTVKLEAREPRALEQRLIQELRAAGVTATGYEQFDVVGLDAELPTPIPLKVREVLDHHHIPAPVDGALIIEIRAAKSP